MFMVVALLRICQVNHEKWPDRKERKKLLSFYSFSRYFCPCPVFTFSAELNLILVLSLEGNVENSAELLFG
jgi:hypothetical protein